MIELPVDARLDRTSHWESGPRDFGWDEYHWHGGSVAIVCTDEVAEALGVEWSRAREAIKPGQIFYLGAVRLRFIDWSGCRDGGFCMRDEGYEGLWFWYRVWGKARVLYMLLKYRIIATLSIWRLAKWESSYDVRWSQVHLIRCILNLGGRSRG